MSTRLLIIVVTMVAGHFVYADEFVDRADANGDGYVSLYELRAAHYADPEFNKRIEQSFSLYDRNGDGRISDDERRLRRAEIEREKKASLARNTEPAADTGTVNAVLPDRGPLQDADRNRKGRSADVVVNAQAARTADSSPILVRQPARPGESTPTADSGRDRSLNVQRSSTGLSRNESWLIEIDTDRSGGASMAELIASGDGQPWFSKADFKAADKNEDEELNAQELGALVSSLERRHR